MLWHRRHKTYFFYITFCITSVSILQREHVLAKETTKIDLKFNDNPWKTKADEYCSQTATATMHKIGHL